MFLFLVGFSNSANHLGRSPPSSRSLCPFQGCDTFTISPAVASKLFQSPYTLDAVEQFEGAAHRMGAYARQEGITTAVTNPRIKAG